MKKLLIFLILVLFSSFTLAINSNDVRIKHRWDTSVASGDMTDKIGTDANLTKAGSSSLTYQKNCLTPGCTTGVDFGIQTASNTAFKSTETVATNGFYMSSRNTSYCYIGWFNVSVALPEDPSGNWFFDTPALPDELRIIEESDSLNFVHEENNVVNKGLSGVTAFDTLGETLMASFCWNGTDVQVWKNGTLLGDGGQLQAVGSDGVGSFYFGIERAETGFGMNMIIDDLFLGVKSASENVHGDVFTAAEQFDLYENWILSVGTPPLISNATCTSCNSLNQTIDSTPTINVTCPFCTLVRIANNSDFTMASATSTRNCTVGSGETFVCTLSASDQLSEFKKFQTLYFWGNDSNGFNHTNFNESIRVALFQQNLTLNGIGSNATYEYETTANITTSFFFIDVLDDTSRWRDQSSPFNYTIDLLRINKFNQSNTSVNISSGNGYSVVIDNRTDLYNATINIIGFSNPMNLSLNYTDIINFPGTLIGPNLFQDKFISNDVSGTSANISFTTAGSSTVFVNTSNQGDLSGGFLNFTMTAYDLDKGNDFDYKENFSNSDHINLSSLLNITAPVSIYDDFENNATLSRYTITGGCSSGSGKFSTGLSDNRFLIGTNVPGTGSNNCKSTFSDIPLDNISLVNFTALITNSYQCGFSCTGSRVYSIILTDLSTEVALYTESSSIGLPSPGGGSSTNEWILIRDESNWIIKQNGSQVGSKSIASLNSPYFLKISTSVSTADQTSASQTFNPFNFQTSGIRLKRLNGTYEINVTDGTFESNTLFSGTSISRILLSTSEIQTEDTSIKYFASNNNGSSYETVVLDNFHTFLTSGNDLKVKFILNSTDNITSPFISSYRAQIVSASPINLLIDVGNDGIIDMEFTGELNSTTTPISYTGNVSGINNYINRTCLADSYCLFPISYTLGSGGIIEISIFNLTKNINPIKLNTTVIQNLNTIPFNLVYTDGTVQLNDIRFDFRGSKNISVVAHQGDYSTSLNRSIFVKYSPFNLFFNQNVDFFDVVYSERNQSNVEPEGQNSSHGIFQITSLAYDGNITVFSKYNNSPHVCLTKQEFRGQNFSISPLNNISTLNISNLTTNYQPIVSDLNSSLVGNVRAYSMINCSGYNFAFIPFEYICFTARCSECTPTFDFEDNCEEII